jgi:hypothetical protein
MPLLYDYPAVNRCSGIKPKRSTAKKDQEEKLMNENKRKIIEAKLFQLFTQTDPNSKTGSPTKTTPTVVKVIRRRKGKPDFKVA